MKKTMSFLKKYRKEAVLGPLFKLTEATFELLIPLVVASIIDEGIAKGDKGLIIRSSLLMVLLGILGFAFAAMAQYFCAKAAVGFGADIRARLFSKIQTLSYSQIDSHTTSTLITRMTADVNSIQNGVNLFLRLFLRSPFIVFGAAFMAFTVDSESAFWFAVVIPVLCLVVFGIMVLSIPLYKKVQTRLDRVLGLTEESISGARVIRAFAGEDDEIARFREENARLNALQKKVGRLSSLMNPLTYVIINAATIALLWTGAVRVDGGALEVGSVVALFNYMSQILVELIKLVTITISITKSMASVSRVEDILFSDGEKKPLPCSRSFSGKVEFENVTMRYAGAGDTSLRNVSFSCEKGQTVGIIGSTGSGKTTLANLIGGLYTPESGTVAIDGRDILSYDQSELLKAIAYVPQKSVLFRGTVRENLLWGRQDATDEELRDALSAAQALSFIEEKGGLDAEVAQGGRNFSGGQRQRLCVARALTRKPEILILDDSSSALDFATDSAMRKAIKSLPFAPTTFIVSQRTSSIMHADKIIVLDDGDAVGIGKHEELLCACPVYREIYDSQFKNGGGNE